MSKFKVYLVRRLDLEAEGDDEREILTVLKNLYPDYTVECIFNEETGKTTDVQICEGCGKMMLEDDVVMMTDEGDYCEDCTEAIKAEIATHEVRCTNEDCGWSGMKNDLQKFHMKLYNRCPRCEEYKYLKDTKTDEYIKPIK